MITVVIKDIKVPKLTLAKERSEMKVPLGAEQEIADRLLKFASRVKAESGEIEFTLRGKFELEAGKWRIAMLSGSTNGAGHSTKKHFKTFEE